MNSKGLSSRLLATFFDTRSGYQHAFYYLITGYILLNLVRLLFRQSAFFSESPLLVIATSGFWFAGNVVLGLIAAWYRQEDTVSLGVLLGIAITIGNVVSTALSLGMLQGSLGIIFLSLMMGILPGLILLVIVTPICIALVWLARYLQDFSRLRSTNDQ